MSLEYIRRELEKEDLHFGPHLVDRMIQYNIDLDQVLSNGKINKKEPDERSHERFTKYSLTKGNISVVVKDSEIPFVIVFRR